MKFIYIIILNYTLYICDLQSLIYCCGYRIMWRDHIFIIRSNKISKLSRKLWQQLELLLEDLWWRWKNSTKLYWFLYLFWIWLPFSEFVLQLNAMKENPLKYYWREQIWLVKTVLRKYKSLVSIFIYCFVCICRLISEEFFL